MTEQRMSYLTDDELERLIADVELQGQLSCPSYVKEEVWARVDVSLKKRKQQLYAYSFKVWAAAAAAIVLLFTIPSEVIMPVREDVPAVWTQDSFTDKLSRQTNWFCERLNDFSDMMIFKENMEE